MGSRAERGVVPAPSHHRSLSPSLPARPLWKTLCALQVCQPLLLPPLGRDLLLSGRLDRPRLLPAYVAACVRERMRAESWAEDQRLPCRRSRV